MLVLGQIRSFRNETADLLALRTWLLQEGCTRVGMESTGVYWLQVYRRLEGFFELVVTNAHQMKAVPGRKTDVQDADWIADLLQHGLLRASFVPSQEQQELRDLTRLRVSLVQERARLLNRVHKVGCRHVFPHTHQLKNGGVSSKERRPFIGWPES
jgi:transposase